MYCSPPIYPAISFAIAGLVIYALVWWWNERQNICTTKTGGSEDLGDWGADPVVN